MISHEASSMSRTSLVLNFDLKEEYQQGSQLRSSSVTYIKIFLLDVSNLQLGGDIGSTEVGLFLHQTFLRDA